MYPLPRVYPISRTLCPSLQIQSGWVISKNWDITVFLGVSLLTLLVPLKLDMSSALRYSLPMVLIYDGVLTFGHAFGTMYPFIFAAQSKKLMFLNYLGLAVLCIGGGIVFFNLHTPLYFTVLSLWLLWHYARQKVGWIYLSEKRAGLGKRFIDELMIYNVCLMPCLIYLASPLPESKLVLMQVDIRMAALSPLLQAPLTAGFWGFIVYWLWDQAVQITKTGVFNPSKYLIVLSGWLCFYLPFVWFPGSFNFWIPALFVHALSYILFTYRFSKNHYNKQNHRSGWGGLPLKNLTIYTATLCLCGGVWAGFLYLSKAYPGGVSYHVFLPGLFSIFFVHFIMDAIIWKKRFTTPPAPSLEGASSKDRVSLQGALPPPTGV